MALTLDDGENLRLLPVVGKGAGQNIDDLLYLRGIDLAITQTDVLAERRARSGEASRITGQIAYVAKLCNEELHILAGPDVRSLQDLAGKPVAVGLPGSGSGFTAERVLRLIDIAITPVSLPLDEALTRLRAGDISAVAIVSGKPAPALAGLAAEGLRLLPVPYTVALEADYLPAKLTEADYPGLIPAGASVETIAVGTALVVYNWPQGHERFARAQRLVDRLFDALPRLRELPRHPKWQETSLAATLPGWRRFPPAEAWLARNAPASAPQPAAAAGAPAATPAVDHERARRLASEIAPNDGAEQQRLYEIFIGRGLRTEPASQSR